MFRKIKDQFYDSDNKIIICDAIEVPKQILTFGTEKPYSILNLREQRINNASGPEIEFHKDFPQFVREAPFLIINRQRWNKLCDRNGIPMNSSERYRNLHLVDFVDPSSSSGIELDSPHHNDRKLEDLVRDEYLSLEYGLQILRYDGLDYKNHIDEIIQKQSIYNPILKIDYKEFSDQFFEEQYQDLIRSFEELCIQHPDWINTRLSGIFLTNDDLRNLHWIPDYIPTINDWSIKFCNKKIIWIDTDSKKSSILKKYSKRSSKRDSIYNILKQLGYL